MRVSEYFSLGRSQPSLDFVDVDVRDDVKIFVDPHALGLVPSSWGDECVSLIQDFFRTVIRAIRQGDDTRAKYLLSSLSEPNETHLGLCEGRSKGRAMGTSLAKDVWEALRKSEAVKTGLIEDLEDTILMVEGVDRDIVSDITTNIIREPLIHYTRDAAMTYGIPLAAEVASGPIWRPRDGVWTQGYVPLPVVEGTRLLLVPKVIVRLHMDYDAGEYYRHYILEELRRQEMESASSSLVQILRRGEKRVTVKSLKAKYGTGKPVNVRETLRHPDLLAKYREDKRKHTSAPLDHLEFSSIAGSPPPDWDKLLDAVRTIKAGAEEADAFEKSIQDLLTALCYPSLANPHPQRRIHDGRKRIDIMYTNVATAGFFRWLSLHYPAPHVFVECKNYDGEIGNPELDQLSGRFSPSRGRVGILVCRHFDDKKLFLQRCIDTAKDDRGFIIPLDDGDLATLVKAARIPATSRDFQLLQERFDQLIL